MKAVEISDEDCPPEVVDRLLWRNAQRILDRHATRPDGTCSWCGGPSPCSPQRLAERAEEVARLPWHEALEARSDITRLLPTVASEAPLPPEDLPAPASADRDGHEGDPGRDNGRNPRRAIRRLPGRWRRRNQRAA